MLGMLNDKLLENCRWRHTNGNCLIIGGFCTPSPFCEAIHKAYEHGKRDAQKWVNVKDKLPDKEVLAIDIYDNIMLGYVYEDNEYSDTGFSCEDEDRYMFEVAYWMEKPEPPIHRRDKNDE